MLPNIDVPIEIIQYFAKSHISVYWQIDDELPPFVKKILEKMSLAISKDTVQDLMDSKIFQQLHADSPYAEKEKIALVVRQASNFG